MRNKVTRLFLTAGLFFIGLQANAKESQKKGGETAAYKELDPQKVELAQPGSHHPIAKGPQVSFARSQSESHPRPNEHAVSDAYMVSKEYKTCPVVADGTNKTYYVSNSSRYQDLVEKSVGDFGGTSSFLVACFSSEDEAKTRGFSASR